MSGFNIHNLKLKKKTILRLLEKDVWKKLKEGKALDANDYKSLSSIEGELSSLSEFLDGFESQGGQSSGSHIHCQECGAYVLETQRGLVFPNMGVRGDALAQLRLFEAVHGKGRGVYEREESVDVGGEVSGDVETH